MVMMGSLVAAIGLEPKLDIERKGVIVVVVRCALGVWICGCGEATSMI